MPTTYDDFYSYLGQVGLKSLQDVVDREIKKRQLEQELNNELAKEERKAERDRKRMISEQAQEIYKLKESARLGVGAEAIQQKLKTGYYEVAGQPTRPERLPFAGTIPQELPPELQNLPGLPVTTQQPLMEGITRPEIAGIPSREATPFEYGEMIEGKMPEGKWITPEKPLSERDKNLKEYRDRMAKIKEDEQKLRNKLYSAKLDPTIAAYITMAKSLDSSADKNYKDYEIYSIEKPELAEISLAQGQRNRIQSEEIWKKVKGYLDTVKDINAKNYILEFIPEEKGILWWKETVEKPIVSEEGAVKQKVVEKGKQKLIQPKVKEQSNIDPMGLFE